MRHHEKRTRNSPAPEGAVQSLQGQGRHQVADGVRGSAQGGYLRGLGELIFDICGCRAMYMSVCVCENRRVYAAGCTWKSGDNLSTSPPLTLLETGCPLLATSGSRLTNLLTPLHRSPGIVCVDSHVFLGPNLMSSCLHGNLHASYLLSL